MRNNIAFGLLFLFALNLNTGCKVLKRVNRSSLDSTYKEQKDYTLIDTGTIVITETIDTTVTAPGIEFSKIFQLKPLPEGFKFPGFLPGLINLSGAMVELSLSYDSLSNSILATGNTKPQQIPVSQTKVTVEKKGLTVKDKGKTETAVKKNELAKEVEKPSKTWIIWLVALLVLIAIVLYINYAFSKYYKVLL